MQQDFVVFGEKNTAFGISVHMLSTVLSTFEPGFPRWLPPVADDGSTKGVPALNRYGRSRSALYRADMAMGTEDEALAREGINPGPDDLVVYARLFRNLDGTPSHPCNRGEA